MSRIKITLNGEIKEISANITILSLIKELELDLDKVAIEKNLEIVESSSFEKEAINEGDQIEIVHFIGGG